MKKQRSKGTHPNKKQRTGLAIPEPSCFSFSLLVFSQKEKISRSSRESSRESRRRRNGRGGMGKYKVRKMQIQREGEQGGKRRRGMGGTKQSCCFFLVSREKKKRFSEHKTTQKTRDREQMRIEDLSCFELRDGEGWLVVWEGF